MKSEKKSILEQMADELERSIKQGEEHGVDQAKQKKAREVLETFRAHFALKKKSKKLNPE